MTSLVRGIAFAIAAMGVTPSGAQTLVGQPRVEELREQLRSDSTSAIAWAAFHAGAFRLREVTPDLATALSNAPRTGPDDWALTAALLDALIQLDAVVEPSTVSPLLQEWPVQALVLLIKVSPDRDRVLLDVIRSPRVGPYAFLAIANVLLTTRPPGFAAVLLRNLPIQLVITVTERDGEGMAGTLGTGFGDERARGCRRPLDFPPLAAYDFSTQRASSTVLSQGPETIYFVRTIHTDGGVTCNGGGTATVGSFVRLKYLMALSAPTTIRLGETENASVTWSSAAIFADQIKGAQQNVIARYDRLLEVLTERGLLTPAERASLPLQLSTRVVDLRSNQRVPLPSLEAK